MCETVSAEARHQGMTKLRLCLAAIVMTLAAGCAADPSQEPATSSTSSLRDHGGGCGPVRYEGYAEAATKDAAAAAAEDDAHQTCFDTPTYCAVDCKGAAVVASSCGIVIVNDDPKVDSFYACTVTISASAEGGSLSTKSVTLPKLDGASKDAARLSGLAMEADVVANDLGN
jgi:hypothetical protein